MSTNSLVASPTLCASPLRAIQANLLGGALWSTLGASASRLLVLLVSVMCARLLGKNQYGQLAMVQATLIAVSSVLDAVLRTSAVKHVAQFRSSDPARASEIARDCVRLSMLLGGGAALLFAFASPLVAARILNDKPLSATLMLGSASLLLGSLNSAQIGILNGLGAFREIAQLAFWSGVASVPLAWIGTAHWGLIGAISASILSIAVSVTLAWPAVAKELRKFGNRAEKANPTRNFSLLWQFGLPSVLSALVFSLATWLSSVFLARQQAGYSELAVSNVAQLWRAAILFVPAALANTWLPAMADAHGQGKSHEFRQLLRTSLFATAGVSTCLALGVALASSRIMAAYGASFASEWIVLVTSAAAALISAIASVAGLVIVCTGQMWWGFALNLLWAVVLVSLSESLAPRGALGIALATLGAYLIHGISVAVFTHMVIRFR